MQLVIMKGFQFEGDDYVDGHAIDVDPVKALRIMHNFSGHVALVTEGTFTMTSIDELVPDQEWPAAPIKRVRTRKAR